MLCTQHIDCMGIASALPNTMTWAVVAMFNSELLHKQMHTHTFLHSTLFMSSRILLIKMEQFEHLKQFLCSINKSKTVLS